MSPALGRIDRGKIRVPAFQDPPRGRRDRLVGGLLLGADTAVGLAMHLVANIEPRGVMTAHLGEDIRPRGDGLRLESLQVPMGRHLGGEDPGHIRLQGHPVDDREPFPRPGVELEDAPVGAVLFPREEITRSRRERVERPRGLGVDRLHPKALAEGRQDILPVIEQLVLLGPPPPDDGVIAIGLEGLDEVSRRGDHAKVAPAPEDDPGKLGRQTDPHRDRRGGQGRLLGGRHGFPTFLARVAPFLDHRRGLPRQGVLLFLESSVLGIHGNGFLIPR